MRQKIQEVHPSETNLDTAERIHKDKTYNLFNGVSSDWPEHAIIDFWDTGIASFLHPMVLLKK